MRSDEIDIVGTKDSSDDGSVRPTLKLSPRRQRGTKRSLSGKKRKTVASWSGSFHDPREFR